MKKFFPKILLCLFLLVVADQLSGLAFDYLVRRQRNGNFYELNYKMFIAKPSIVILGSSRASHHYNTNLVQQKLNAKTINYGADGTDIFLSYITLKNIIKTNVPKMVILDIRPDDFSSVARGADLVSYYPFLNRMDVSAKDLDVISVYEKFKVKLQCYRYNNLLVTLLLNTKGKLADTASITGYLPLTLQKNTITKQTINYNAWEQGSFIFFEKIAVLCKQNHIQLIACTSPCFDSIVQNKSLDKTTAFCNKAGIPFFNYLNNRLLFFGEHLYKDNNHLNSKGATIFTLDLINRISGEKE